MESISTHIIKVKDSVTTLMLQFDDNSKLEHTERCLDVVEHHISNKNLIAELLTRAVNNRTRERNYFRLCLQLANGEIEDGQFDKEIEDNEDDYVISTDIQMTPDDIRFAIELAKDIKDVNTVEDLQDVFSIDPASTRKAIEN